MSRPTDRALPPLPRGDRNENPKGITLSALLWEDFVTHDRNLASTGGEQEAGPLDRIGMVIDGPPRVASPAGGNARV